MDLTQLRMFCCVAETGSVARAAEQLHRVPSNLTTRLRQLEQELGADLFIRENSACACRRWAITFCATPTASWR